VTGRMEEPRYQLEGTHEIVDLFSEKLTEVLEARGFEETLHVVRPGAPDVWQYERRGRILSVTEQDLGPDGRLLTVETEESTRAAVQALESVVAEAVRRAVKLVRDTLLRSARGKELRERIEARLERA
jgi:hypothetical protein